MKTVKTKTKKPKTVKSIKVKNVISDKTKDKISKEEEKSSENTDNIENTKRKYTKRKLSKADIEKALKIKAEIISENRKVFEGLGKGALDEFDIFKPCNSCKFIRRGCASLGCGVVMKWMMRKDYSSDVNINNNSTVYRRATSSSEFYDTTAVRPGLAEEVDEIITNEGISNTFQDNPNLVGMNEYESETGDYTFNDNYNEEEYD